MMPVLPLFLDPAVTACSLSSSPDDDDDDDDDDDEDDDNDDNFFSPLSNTSIKKEVNLQFPTV